MCGPVGDKRVDCCDQLRQLFVCFEMAFQKLDQFLRPGPVRVSNINSDYLGSVRSSHSKWREIFEK